MQKKFRGTGVALITPFKKDFSIDYDALEKLIHQVTRGGVNFLVALGTTAETPTLSIEEKKEVLDFIKKINAGNLPLVCGIGGNNTEEVIAQIHTLDLNGIEAILSVAPYYNKPTQEGLYQHFKAIAESTGTPVILYNVPGRTSSNLLPETVIRLASDFKNIIGIKEASGNITQCMELVQSRPDKFVILSGDDDLTLPQIALGMDGVISVAANCFAEDFSYMVNAALVNKFDRARDIHYKLLNGIRLLFKEGNPAGVKAVLNRMGVCENVLRLPLMPVSEKTNDGVKEFLKTI